MSFYTRYGKRWIDVAASTMVALLTSPLHGVCALLVRLTSGRPVYFAQVRAGKDGAPFRLLKFRTMKVGTHEASGGYPTADMVTPVGRFLRKTSLDELPQLVNIVKGDMSIVGPRPALMEQVQRYDDRQRGRLLCRPGLTGLAQVRYRNQATWSVRIESDLEYSRSVTLFHDLAIVLRTVPAVLFGTGVAVGQAPDMVDDLAPVAANERND